MGEDGEALLVLLTMTMTHSHVERYTNRMICSVTEKNNL